MDFIVTQGRMKERSARQFFRQVVAAIDYCHSLRVIHRDLKAENLLLDGQFHVKVIDFGLSNRWAPGELLQTFCGSPTYTAPELIRRQRYEGPEIDVWSLGVLLYVLVCGSLPFDGNSFQELFGRIIRGEYFVPDHVSMECRDLIGRMLVVDPSQRATLDQVRTHRWILDDSGQPVPKSEPLGFANSPSSANDLDEFALEECERIGYDRDTVIRSVIGNLYDDAAATYFLVVSRKRKDEEIRAQRRQKQLADEQVKATKAQQQSERHHLLAHSAQVGRVHPHSAEPTPSKHPVVPRIAALAGVPIEGDSRGPSSAPTKKYRKSDQRPTKRKEPKIIKSPEQPPKVVSGSDEAPALADPQNGTTTPNASVAPAASTSAPPPAHLRHRRHRTVGTTTEIMNAIAQDEQKAQHEETLANRHMSAGQTPIPSGSPTILTPRSDSPESISPRSPQKSPSGSPRSSASVEVPPLSFSKDPSPPGSSDPSAKKKGHRRLSETSPQRRPVVIRDAKDLQLLPEGSDETLAAPTIRVSQPSPRGHKRRSRPSSRDKGDPTTALATSPSSGSLSSSSGSEAASGVHKRHRSVDNEEPKQPIKSILKSPRSRKDSKSSPRDSPTKSPGALKPRPSLSLEADDDSDEWTLLGNLSSSRGQTSISGDGAVASPRHASDPAALVPGSSTSSKPDDASSSDSAKVPRHSSMAAAATPVKEKRTISSGSSERSWLDSLKRGLSGLLQRGGGSKPPEPRQARFPLNEQSTSHRPAEEILEQIKTALASLNIPYTFTSPFCLKCELETVGFEVEICRLPLLYLNGVRFRRIYGDAWRYTEYGREILNKLNLKDEATSSKPDPNVNI
jgi:serine/threonine protein kinase